MTNCIMKWKLHSLKVTDTESPHLDEKKCEAIALKVILTSDLPL